MTTKQAVDEGFAHDARACAVWGIATWLSGMWLFVAAHNGWTVVFVYSVLVAYFVSGVTVIYALGILLPSEREKEESV